MRILHVSLGWPPLRTGGLVRYCCDLMHEQQASGHTVAMLHPDGNAPLGKPHIKKEVKEGVESYSLHSNNLVPLNFGVANPADLFQSQNLTCYEDVINDFQPDVVHVHSIQGFDISFFKFLKKNNIKIAYTTHDYYPLCLRSNLVDCRGNTCSGPSEYRCASCNYRKGLKLRESKLMQSKLYAALKTNPLVKELRRRKKSRVSYRGQEENRIEVPGTIISEYSEVRKELLAIVELFDVVIANSELAASWYKKETNCNHIEIIPITHSGLRSSQIRTRRYSQLTIGYVGGANRIKGYEILLDALAMLPKEIDWVLYFYGTPLAECEQRKGVICKGEYSGEQTASVLSELDVLIVPSVAPETYSLSTIEALCAGTPVICSDMVGAASLIPDSAVYPHRDAQALANTVTAFYESKGESALPSLLPNFDLRLHADRLLSLYQRL